MRGPSRPRPHSDTMLKNSRPIHRITKSVYGHSMNHILSTEDVVSAYNSYQHSIPLETNSSTLLETPRKEMMSPEQVVSAYDKYQNSQNGARVPPFQLKGHPYSGNSRSTSDSSSSSSDDDTITYWPFMDLFSSPEKMKGDEDGGQNAIEDPTVDALRALRRFSQSMTG